MKLKNQIIGEFLGTAGLLIAVVGSGIMGEKLAQGNGAIALLANSIATGAGLFVLILCFGPISGAHFNPVVSFTELLWKRITGKTFALYTLAQIAGGIFGVLFTHAMFGQKLLQLSTHDRGDSGLLLSEVIATFGLIMTIALSGKKSVGTTPAAVALYITGAYWFTSSTSFANPAVTIARSLTDTFSGIAWTSMPAFIGAQFVGALIAYGIVKLIDNKL